MRPVIDNPSRILEMISGGLDDLDIGTTFYNPGKLVIIKT